MSSRRFKTILLLLLLAVNLCLLAVAIPVYQQRERQRSALAVGLMELLEQQQIGLEPELLADALNTEQTLYRLELTHSDSAELLAVNTLLPGARADRSSPYETRWTATEGSCVAGMDGSFSLGSSAINGSNPEQLLTDIGFQACYTERGVRSVTAWQEIAGVSLLSPLRLSVSDSGVTADGCFLFWEGTPLRTSAAACCSAADAVVAFLANRDSLGWVGSEIVSLEQGYVPAEGVSALSVTPVWRIGTDTADYDVDGLSRYVYLVE